MAAATSALMGALADSALQAGGEVIGVIPERLVAREVGPQWVDQTAPRGVHARTEAENGGAFRRLYRASRRRRGRLKRSSRCLPGRNSESIRSHAPSWMWSSIMPGCFQFLDHMAEQRFIKKEHLAALIRGDDPVDLLTRFTQLHAGH